MEIKKRRGQGFRRAVFAAWLITAGAAQSGAAAEPPVPPLAPPAAKGIPVKVIVVANFEPGDDTGDAPGEFQFWAEREHLDEVIPLRGALHPLRRNQDGLYGVVWGYTGSMLGGSAEQLMALVLDPCFDFTKTYWLFTGISGVTPRWPR